MQEMKTYPNNFFDLAIVDPPYGIDIANMNLGIGKSKKASKIENRKWKKKQWDKEKPTHEYFNELFRVSRNQIIWGGNHFDIKPCYGYVIWDKEIPDGLSFADCELAWHSFRVAPKIFKHSVYLGKGGKFHPTQKPIALYIWLLNNYAKQGDLILDTHVGSASSLIACEKMDFDYVGYEIDIDYYNAAQQRLKEFRMQTDLFRDQEQAEKR